MSDFAFDPRDAIDEDRVDIFYESSEANRLDGTVYRITVGDLEQMVGRRLTDDEVDRFAELFASAYALKAIARGIVFAGEVAA